MHRVVGGAVDQPQQENANLSSLQGSELSHGVLVAERATEPPSLPAETLCLIL